MCEPLEGYQVVNLPTVECPIQKLLPVQKGLIIKIKSKIIRFFLALSSLCIQGNILMSLKTGRKYEQRFTQSPGSTCRVGQHAGKMSGREAKFTSVSSLNSEKSNSRVSVLYFGCSLFLQGKIWDKFQIEHLSYLDERFTHSAT